MKMKSRVIAGVALLFVELWVAAVLLTDSYWWGKAVAEYGILVVFILMAIAIPCTIRSRLHWIEKTIWLIPSIVCLLFAGLWGAIVLMDKFGFIDWD